MPDSKGTLDLRCECSRRPLLAKCGRDAEGVLFVHIKVYKQSRIYTEALFTDGTVRIRCRECNRWYRLTIKQGPSRHTGAISMEPTPQPDEVPQD